MTKFFKVSIFILSAVFICVLSTFFALFVITKDAKLIESKLVSNDKTYEYYDQNNQLVYTENQSSSGEYIEIDCLNDYTINAFIAVEDKRFFKHNGLDYRRIISASVKNLTSLKFKEGASTISQQLIKNTHLTSEKTLKRKFSEWKITKELENKYSKKEILEKYLNTIYFGNGAYGINSASKLYFSKSADKLTLNESCALAGIIKAPSIYSPISNYDNMIKRKNVVLKLMLDENYIDKNSYNSAINSNLIISEKPKTSPYFYYFNAVKEELESLEIINPYTKNNKVKIYTYLDTVLQENVAVNFIKDVESTPVNKIIINCKNFGVSAFFGKNSKLKRCPASAIKPIVVYAPQINENFILESDVILDEKTNFNGYCPKNYGDKYYGNVTVKEALSKSLNASTVKLLDAFTLKKTKKYLDAFNLSNEKSNLSSALGVIDGGMTLKEICDCYSTFNNSGIYTTSSFIDKVIVDNITIYNRKLYSKQVFTQETAFIVSDMLKDCVKNGTSKKLRDISYDICAKTGTNGNENGNLDAYSICYTTEHIIGVWMGNYDNKPMQNEITGGSYPTIYSRNILENLYKNYAPKNFIKPENVVELKLNKQELLQNKRAVIDENGETFYYVKGTEPNVKLKGNEIIINDVNISLVSGVVKIKIDAKNVDNIKIVRTYNGQSNDVYNGEFIRNFNDYLIDFGKYEYYIEFINGYNISKITLPIINYQKSNLNILDDEWWNNDF